MSNIYESKTSYYNFGPDYYSYHQGQPRAINALKNKLDELVVCRYSFRRKGKWFIKDLLSKKTEPFSYKLILSD